MPTLFDSYKMGSFFLKNRVVLPPMTRSRARNGEHVPNAALMAPYYAQRAGAGLLISEGMQVTPMGQGYAWTPGIYNSRQVEEWKKITQAVHQADGVFFAQLWHVGRVSHPDNLGGKQPLGASAIAPKGVQVFVEKEGKAEFKDVGTPKEMSKDDIQEAIAAFGKAARNAIDAGFDGVELHGANGYLINQFLESGSNSRTDSYGGSLENRLRFLVEVVEALVSAVGAERVGVRLAPLTTLNGCEDAHPEETYTAAVRRLDAFSLAYVHIAEVDWDNAPEMPLSFKQALREAFSGTLIYAGKYDKERAMAALDEGWADLIGFGRPFIANPDLVERLKGDIPLALHDRDTLFGGDAKGLTDYPVHQGK